VAPDQPADDQQYGRVTSIHVAPTQIVSCPVLKQLIEIRLRPMQATNR